MMGKSTFVYVTYIRSTPAKVFKALTDQEITRQYWGHENISADWKPGSAWQHRDPKTNTVRIVGSVVESAPPDRLVITWASPENADRRSRVSFDIEMIGDMVKLTVTHDDLEAGSEMDKGIRFGWPRVLSSLKSYLETGHALDVWAMKAKETAR